jgi:hypothetical protein
VKNQMGTKNCFHILNSSLGNAVLSSIVMAGLVAGAATVAYRNFSTTYSSTRVGRVKAKQTVVEAQVRRRALQPEAYLDCNSPGIASCKVNPAYFSDLGNQSVAGARCDDRSAICGVTVRSLNFTPSTRIFSAEVAYGGREANVKPTQVRLEIPFEVLQSPKFNCGDKDKTKPIFVGFREGTGEPICEGFNSCPIGQFVKGVDVSKRTLICQDLPRNIACGEQSMFTHLGWVGHAVDYDCSPLPDPPFTSNLNTRVLASVRVTETSTETRTETVTVSTPGGTPSETPGTSDPGGTATSPPAGSGPNPAAPATGTWVYFGMNMNTGGICPGGTMMGTMFRGDTFGPCTTIGATCSVNVMGNALAGGGGHVRNYQCVQQ